MPGADDRDETCTFDLSLYRRLDTELGLMNTTLPESLLGADLDITAPIAAIEAMSECDPAIALSFLSQELLFPISSTTHGKPSDSLCPKDTPISSVKNASPAWP